MPLRCELAIILTLAAPSVAACMRSDPAPAQRSASPVQPLPPQLPKPFDGPLTGKERVVWEQAVGAGTNTTEFTFFISVDGSKQPLPNVECHLLQGSRHHICEAPLPTLTPGRHTLRLGAARTVDGQEKNSPLSPPLVVVRAASSGSS